jgi:HSP20 family protein
MVTYYVSPRRRLAHRFGQMTDAARPDVQIPVDVIAEGDDYRITALVPGVNAEDLQIEILEDVVSIKGEFVSYLDDDAKILRQERPAGIFERTMRLPAMLNAAGAEAEVINGVLNLRVPKAEEAKAKQIKVKVK